MGHPTLCVLSYIIFITFASSSAFIDPDWKTFADPQSNYSTSLIEVHNVTGDVYVVTLDNLYHLDSDLVLKKKVVMGPQTVCKRPATSCDQMTLQAFRPYAMKIVYHLESHYLMLCGSLYDGMCQLRLLHDLDHSFWIGPYDDQVAHCVRYKNDPAIFGPGYGKQIVFYSGTDRIPSNNTEDLLPFFSSKVLVHENGQFRFKYSYKSDSSMSAIFFKFQQKQILLYSFIHESYVYFLYVRSASGYQTILARICLEDANFTSYVEQRLGCDEQSNEYYTATAAFFGPGFLNGLPVEHLYLVFEKEFTVICSFSITSLQRLFEKTVEQCFEGSNNTSTMNLDTGHLNQCHKSRWDDDDFCGSSINPYIYTRTVAISVPSITINVRELSITSLAVFEQNNNIVGFIGARRGIFAKILIENSQGRSMLHVGIAGGYLIQPSPAFDLKQEHIYFLVHNKIIKYPIRTCSIHKTCDNCFDERFGPLQCGWCDGRCTMKEECSSKFYTSSCSPSISSVKPLIGPTHGGTHLTILGKNFGTFQPLSTFNHIFIKDVPCNVLLWEMERVMCITRPSRTELIAPVVLRVRDNSNQTLKFSYEGTAQSNESFIYVETKLNNIVPDRGSISGGTNVTIFGTHLDIGKDYLMNIRGRICTDLKVKKFFVTCITGRSVDPHLKDAIEMKMDEVYIPIDPSDSGSSKPFQYLPDPEIYRIHPTETVLSYRGNITVAGRYLNSVEDPQMLVRINASDGRELKLIQKCWLKPQTSGSIMSCPMPALETKDFTFPKGGQPIVGQVNFKMFPFKETFPDLETSQLSFYPEPEFRQVQKILDNQTSLEIKGKYPNYRSLDKVINVQIGESEPCNITDLTSDTLHCQFRPALLTNTSVWGKNLSVQVFMGSSQRNVGYLVIKELMVEEPVVEKKSWPIILASVFAVCLFLVVAIVAWWCFRRRRQNKSPTNFMNSPSSVLLKNDYRPGPKLLQARSAAAVPSPEDTSVKQPLIRTFSRQPSTTSATTSLICNTPSIETTIPEASASEVFSHPGYLGMDKKQGGITVPSKRESAMARRLRETQQDASEDTMSLDETLRLLVIGGWMIPKERLILGVDIGAGQYGCVYEGKYTCPKKGDIRVAVKTIRGGPFVPGETVKDFLNEAFNMRNFKHEHVLELIGICHVNRIPMIVLPLMENGDLCSYLRKEEHKLFVPDLLKFAFQVASGMNYLAEAKFVHRDLAARNCVMDGDTKVKVADFGLSRDIYESDYYLTETEDRKLPYKWMAPETIELDKFTVISDVWSYGIVLWEIMTRGVMPYENIDNKSILHYVKSGRRLPQPQFCSDNLYEVMLNCWDYVPSKRPSFGVLHDVIKQLWTSVSYKNRVESVNSQHKIYV